MTGGPEVAPRRHRVSVMGGDGVGPELVAHALRVLDAVAAIEGFTCELVHLPHSGDHYRATGVILDDVAVDTVRGSEALLFGASGDPDLPPGTMELGLMLGLVDRLGLDVSIRPAILHADWLSPLRGAGAGDIDLVIVRDSAEFGLRTEVARRDTDEEVAVATLLYTAPVVRRVLRVAFATAMRRRRHVTVVAQSQAIPAHTIWTRTATALAAEFPDVEVRMLYPDAAAAVLVQDPRSVDVLATTLWIGGTFSDLVGALIGGIGLTASARVNVQTRAGMFEPAHGSAPKYRGLDRVSPLGTIHALAMLLEHIGEVRGARLVEAAITHALVTRTISSVTTRGGMGTGAATDAVIAALDAVSPAVV